MSAILTLVESPSNLPLLMSWSYEVHHHSAALDNIGVDSDPYAALLEAYHGTRLAKAFNGMLPTQESIEEFC